jgi:AcrR family transcriptional regulator
MNDPARGRETRARIQAVAVELFTEQGYDKTSLREIAERLNVTKAALYYHFRSKEDIVASLVDDYVSQIDELIAWGAQQPRSPQTRAEILRRYVGIVTEGHSVFRMLHQNQAAASSMSGSKGRSELFKERLRALTELLSEPGASLAEQLRAAMALGGISVAWMSFADEVTDHQALCAAMLAVASDMAGAAPPEQARAAAAS